MRPLGGGVEAAAHTLIGQEGRPLEHIQTELIHLCWDGAAFTAPGNSTLRLDMTDF